ncbi:hypothetical protein [uncultured Oscillibacter sp.]|jgi:hypothetical protein|uniref:hypothetical protein n=1 Tax=uncultured Oscillibacter sp. TaxID=876091 RepID=UPI0025EDE66C|nr:hypothetical protein [uncultured Oscillibacter sp.]
MARKTIGAAPPAPEGNPSGIYMYIGPSLKGLIQTGTIYRGDRARALEQAAAAIDARPLVKTLIVSGSALPEARRKVKTPGNVLYANYQELAGK